jgi:hypothetical protein
VQLLLHFLSRIGPAVRTSQNMAFATDTYGTVRDTGLSIMHSTKQRQRLKATVPAAEPTEYTFSSVYHTQELRNREEDNDPRPKQLSSM